MCKVFLTEGEGQKSERHELEVIMGITDEERQLLWEIAVREKQMEPGKEPVDQVFRVMAWVMREVGRRQREGGLKVPPPVLSRLYQVLSDGHNGFMQAKKVSYTPFPLPYAQLVLFFLIVLMFSSPFVIVAYVDNIVVASILSFCATLGYFALNEVGRELEDPFRHDPNDLPLSEVHYDFNVRLVSLLHMGMRQNSVNHINLEYLEEGPVRERFKTSFSKSVTDKTSIKRGVELSESQRAMMQGNLLETFESPTSLHADMATALNINLPEVHVQEGLGAMEVSEGDSMPLSPRGSEKATESTGPGVLQTE